MPATYRLYFYREGMDLTSKKSVTAYRNTKIMTASQGSLLMLLYDEALKQLSIATDELDKKDVQMDKVNNAIVRCQEMITELIASLDFEKGGEISDNLFNLYMYFNQELTNANISKNKEVVVNIKNMMSKLRESWVQVVAKEGDKKPDTAPAGINIAG